MSRRAGPARERSDLRGPAGHNPLEKGAPHDRAPLLEPRGSAIAVPAQAQAVIDQSHTSPHNLGAALNECCGFSSQSFTSSVTGDSVAVSVNIIGRDGSEALLRLDIETAEDGLPTGAVLGSAVLPTAGSLIGDMVFLGAPVPLTAGAEYAIVARYENAPPPGPGSGQGHWTGSSGNIYTRGQHVSHDGTRWLYDGLGFDLHFITWMGGGDLDGDGWFAPDDCDDNDAAVYPGAPEVRWDDIDQDCNGYDMTIDVFKANYEPRESVLKVKATSSLGAAAGLEVLGDGPMRFKSDTD